MPAPPRVASLAAVPLLLATSFACKPAATAPPAAAPTPASAPAAELTKPRVAWTHACSPAEASGCTDAHPPVCGQKSDLTRATFTDSCAACSDPEVLFYSPGTCRERAAG